MKSLNNQMERTRDNYNDDNNKDNKDNEDAMMMRDKDNEGH